MIGQYSWDTVPPVLVRAISVTEVEVMDLYLEGGVWTGHVTHDDHAYLLEEVGQRGSRFLATGFPNCPAVDGQIYSVKLRAQPMALWGKDRRETPQTNIEIADCRKASEAAP